MASATVLASKTASMVGSDQVNVPDHPRSAPTRTPPTMARRTRELKADDRERDRRPRHARQSRRCSDDAPHAGDHARLTERERAILAARDAARFKDKARRAPRVKPFDEESGAATCEGADG